MCIGASHRSGCPRYTILIRMRSSTAAGQSLSHDLYAGHPTDPASAIGLRMTGKTKLPRLIETPDGGGVELADGVIIRWWRRDDLWSVEIKTTPGRGGVDLRNITVVPAVH